jgi:hypothetical protein
MSNLSITTGVVDSDHKGTTGRGTIFWMEILFGEERHYYEWGLLEELNGSFKPDEITKPFKVWAREQQKIQDDSERKTKEDALSKRKSEVSLPGSVIQVINQIVGDNPDIVNQFKSGNVKALNSLVGKVIAITKKNGIACDAFSISTYVTGQLS